jgi:hypothetical protein
MKRKFVLLTIISAAFCQTLVAQSLKLIPKVGLGSATYSYSEEMKKAGGLQTVNSVTVFSFGVGLEVKLADKLALQPEFNYNQTGNSYDIKEGSGSSLVSIKADYKYNTLQVPVLLKYSLFGPESFRFSILAGPYYSYNLGGSYKADITFGSTTSSVKGDLIWDTRPANYNGTDAYASDDDLNRGDLGAILGLAGGLKFGPGELYLEARYMYGFTNFAKSATNSQGGAVGDLGSASRVIGIQVGYAVPLGR